MNKEKKKIEKILLLILSRNKINKSAKIPIII